MATPVSSVPEYCAVLGRSRLIDDTDLTTVRAKWTAEPKNRDADVDGFRKFLIREKFLTEYQAALIQRGRADGFVVSEYVILDRIGSGQSAGVYKAIHKSGQVVALKVLPASKARDQYTLNRFQREGRLLCQLDHPNVVRAYQVGQANGVHFIVMEHLEGETLDAVLDRRRTLPPGEAVRLAVQALNGLQHLHDKRMIHRDVKPSNLMLLPPGKADTLACTVKILDVGLGRELFDDTSPATQDLHLTTEGALLGTPDYLAPEQARDARSSDIRADVYSLGCVLYHLLAGRPPFGEKNVMAQMVKHATESATPVRELAPDVSAELSKAIGRLMAKAADDRPATPAAAADLLRPFVPAKAAVAVGARLLPAYQAWLATESAMELPADVKQAVNAASGTPKSERTPAVTAPAVKVKPAAKPVAKSTAKSAPAPAAAPTAPAPSQPKPASVPDFNVELVDEDEEEDDDGDERGLLDLDRRDWLMLGSGGFLMLAAIGTGFGLTMLTKKKPDPDAMR